MSNPNSIPNHTVNTKTGFIESNAYVQAFDSDKKLAFLSLFRQNGLKFWRTCAELGVRGDTVNKHYNLDPVFRSALEQTKIEYFDELEGVSRENALNPRSVIERIFQLKSRFPSKYGDNKIAGEIQISINLDGKVLQNVAKREQVIEADVLPSTPLETVDNQHSKDLESQALSDNTGQKWRIS